MSTQRRLPPIWEDEPTRFLSLGAGVQSSVLLMLSIRGEIERPDHVIFADTGWEPSGVYDHLRWLTMHARNAGIPVHIAKASSEWVRHIRKDALRGYHLPSGHYRWDGRMPVFVDNAGKKAQINRQCTYAYKIRPMRRIQRVLMGYKPGQRIPIGRAETAIGFSTDETRRAGNGSRDRWNEHVYPLISEMRFSRSDCLAWWERYYPNQPLVKSSCIGCPYRSDAEWARMRSESPAEFEDACDFDDRIRKVGGLRATAYLHRSCQPLRDVRFSQQEEMDLPEPQVCNGGCGT